VVANRAPRSLPVLQRPFLCFLSRIQPAKSSDQGVVFARPVARPAAHFDRQSMLLARQPLRLTPALTQLALTRFVLPRQASGALRSIQTVLRSHAAHGLSTSAAKQFGGPQRLSAATAARPTPAGRPASRCTTPCLASVTMVQYFEGERASSKGHKLLSVTYLPEAAAGPPSAVLLFHHGISEHIGRYKSSELAVCLCLSSSAAAAAVQCRRAPGGGAAACWLPVGWSLTDKPPHALPPPRACPCSLSAVFERFAEAGIAVYSGDIVGHGRSEGHRALVENINDTVRLCCLRCSLQTVDWRLASL
jgi:hypothetical protein